MSKVARWLLAFVAVTAMVAPLPAAADARIALVLGNASYERGPIRTSLADAGLVAEALNSIGFEIVEGADLDQADLRRTFREFLARVESAGPEAIAFVYFSGYGLEFEGENYLVPIDARLARESDIPLEAIRISDLIHSLAAGPARSKIVVLDASRPLPFTIPVAPGLSPMDAPPGVVLASATAPGTFAEDSGEAYGAYASAIAEMVREPGIDLYTAFTGIRLRTHALTQGRQTPWDIGSLPGDVILVPAEASADAAAPDQGVSQASVDATSQIVLRDPRPMRELDPDEAYGLAIETDSLPSYVEYVETFPDSPYAPRIWAIMRARREALSWRRALELNTREAYWTYLSRYPGGVYTTDAQRHLRRLAALTEPPPGFVPIEFVGVPPPLAGERRDYVHVYAPLPRLPQNLIGPRPSLFASLPPPQPPPGPQLLPPPVGIPVLPQIGQPPQRSGPPVTVITPAAPGGNQGRLPGAIQPGYAPPGSAPARQFGTQAPPASEPPGRPPTWRQVPARPPPTVLQVNPQPAGNQGSPPPTSTQPYGTGVSPYGAGVSPYGAGASPYGTGASPYRAGVSPYGVKPPASPTITRPMPPVAQPPPAVVIQQPPPAAVIQQQQQPVVIQRQPPAVIQRPPPVVMQQQPPQPAVTAQPPAAVPMQSRGVPGRKCVVINGVERCN